MHVLLKLTAKSGARKLSGGIVCTSSHERRWPGSLNLNRVVVSKFIAHKFIHYTTILLAYIPMHTYTEYTEYMIAMYDICTRIIKITR